MELATFVEATTVKRSDDLLRTCLHRRPEDVRVEQEGGVAKVPFESLGGGGHVVVCSAILLGAATGRLSPLATATLHNGTTIAVLARPRLR